MSYDLSIVQLRETAAQFRASLPVPLASQLCIEVDTGRAFVGDGATVITSLLDLKLTGEERTHADLVWDQMRLGDGRDEVGEGAEPGAPVVFAPGIAYTFNTDQTSDPAAGTFRFNNGNILGATEMYIHKTDASANTHDQSGWFNLMTSGVAKVFCESGNVLTLSVTRMTVTSDVYTFSIARTSGAKPTSNENCYVDFMPDAPGVRVIQGTITQDGGANAPTITLVKNSSVADISAIVYGNVGDYMVTMTGAFSSDTYHAPTVVSPDDNGTAIAMRVDPKAGNDPNKLQFRCRDLSDTPAELGGTFSFTIYIY